MESPRGNGSMPAWRPHAHGLLYASQNNCAATGSKMTLRTLEVTR